MPLSGREGGTPLHHFTAALPTPHSPWHTDQRQPRSRELHREEGGSCAPTRGGTVSVQAALGPHTTGHGARGPRPAGARFRRTSDQHADGARAPGLPAQPPPTAGTHGGVLRATGAGSTSPVPASRGRPPTLRPLSLRGPTSPGLPGRWHVPASSPRVTAPSRAQAWGRACPAAGPSAGSEPLTRGAPRPPLRRLPHLHLPHLGPGPARTSPGNRRHPAGSRRIAPGSEATPRVASPRRRTGIGCSYCGVIRARPARVSLATHCAGSHVEAKPASLEAEERRPPGPEWDPGAGVGPAGTGPPGLGGVGEAEGGPRERPRTGSLGPVQRLPEFRERACAPAPLSSERRSLLSPPGDGRVGTPQGHTRGGAEATDGTLLGLSRRS